MACSHTHFIEVTETDVYVCEECIKSGDTWVHLRMCMTCGHVGCCDSSKNKHARKHYLRSGHPIIRSIEPGESWRYCYIDDEIISES
ncbi:MAG: UBP-type zinc finger domain-containing protein [Bacteroidota bacterium]